MFSGSAGSGAAVFARAAGARFASPHGKLGSVRNTLCKLVLILLFPASCLVSAQKIQRCESGPYKGFTRSPTEHILDEIRTPIKVRSIRGVIKNPGGEPLSEVIVE